MGICYYIFDLFERIRYFERKKSGVEQRQVKVNHNCQKRKKEIG